MKKLIIFLTCIGFCFALLNNCSDSSNPVKNEETSLVQLQKHKKPKVDGTINNLTIGGVQLIIDDNLPTDVDIEEPSTHPVIDITDNVLIEYEVTSSVDIDYVRIEIRYDANTNSEIFNKDEGDDYLLEIDNRIFRDEYPGDNDNVAIGSYDWDGTVNPLGILSGSVYGSDGTYKLFDKLSSYNYQSGKPIVNDHYLLKISAYTDCCSFVASQTAYVWFTGADNRPLELNVNDIIIQDATNKNKKTPTAIITIGDNNGSIFTGSNAYIAGRWEGLSEGTISTSGPSGIDGKITITGPSFRKNKAGELRFVVSNIQHKTGVYNPWANNKLLGEWPERPHLEVKYP